MEQKKKKNRGAKLAYRRTPITQNIWDQIMSSEMQITEYELHITSTFNLDQTPFFYRVYIVWFVNKYKI